MFPSVSPTGECWLEVQPWNYVNSWWKQESYFTNIKQKNPLDTERRSELPQIHMFNVTGGVPRRLEGVSEARVWILMNTHVFFGTAWRLMGESFGFYTRLLQNNTSEGPKALRFTYICTYVTNIMLSSTDLNVCLHAHIHGHACASPWVWVGPRCPGYQSRPASPWSSAPWQSWFCCWAHAAAPGTPGRWRDCLEWCCKHGRLSDQHSSIPVTQLSWFLLSSTRSWLQAPPVHPPADWGDCVQPACSSAGRSCWQTVAAESGSRCWWRTGRSGSHSACPPFAGKITITAETLAPLAAWLSRGPQGCGNRTEMSFLLFSRVSYGEEASPELLSTLGSGIAALIYNSSWGNRLRLCLFSHSSFLNMGEFYNLATEGIHRWYTLFFPTVVTDS